MFKKLLKYDFHSVWRFWWILAVTALGLTTVSSLFLRFLLYTDGGFVMFRVFAAIITIASLVVVAISTMMTPLVVYLRFYQHFFSDEGYLTFTLPVSRKKMLLSKTVNALIFLGLEAVLLFACLTLISLIVPNVDDGAFLFAFKIFESIGESIGTLWQTVGAWTILYLLEGLLILVGFGILSTSLIYFCITQGAVVARKHKVLAAIGIYYLVNGVLSFLGSFLLSLSVTSFVNAAPYLNEHLSSQGMFGLIALALFLTVMLVATLALTAYFLTQHLLERKLNLN